MQQDLLRVWSSNQCGFHVQLRTQSVEAKALSPATDSVLCCAQPTMATLTRFMLAVLGTIMIISFSCTHAVQLSKQDPATLCTAAFAEYEALHHRLAVARGRSVLPIGETGLSDRMAGIVTAFYYAVLTNR